MSTQRFKIAFRFVPIPWEMPRDRRLSDGAKNLFAIIMQAADWSTKECRISQSDLAEYTGGTDRTVRRYLRELATAGYVSASRTGQESLYELQFGPDETVRSDRTFTAPGDRTNGARGVGVELDLDLKALPNHKLLPDTNGGQTSSAGMKRFESVRRAAEFGKVFGEMYQAVYRRVMPSLSEREKLVLAEVMKAWDRSLAKVREVHGIFRGPDDTTEETIKAALVIAWRAPYEIWFLRRGDPMGIGEFLRHWKRLFDRLLQEAQNRGKIPEAASV
jgi:DNA-binding transcriptional ArsR family regulator